MTRVCVLTVWLFFLLTTYVLATYVLTTCVLASDSFYLYDPPECSKLTVTVNQDTKYPSVNLQTGNVSDNCTVDIYCTDDIGNIQYTCTHIKLNRSNFDKRNGHSMYGCTCKHTLVCVQSDTAPVCTPVFELKP